MYRAGILAIRFGKVFAKGLSMQAGQCPVSLYNRSESCAADGAAHIAMGPDPTLADPTTTPVAAVRLACSFLLTARSLLISILRERLRVSNALNVEVIGLEQAVEAYKRFDAGQPNAFSTPHPTA